MFFARSGLGGAAPIGGFGRKEPTPETTSLGPYELGIRDFRDSGELLAQWRDLAKRVDHANVFCEPDILASFATHVDSCRSLRLLCCWRGKRLVGVMPFVKQRAIRHAARIIPPPLELARAGAPLLDPADAAPALRAMVAYVISETRLAADLVLDTGDDDGLVTVLREALDPLAVTLHLPEGSADARITRRDGVVAPNLADKLRVQRVSRLPDLRNAVEDFLIEDARFAQAEGRFALVQIPGQANLVRAVTRILAALRRCHVVTISRDSQLIASAIVLAEGKAARLWLLAASRSASGVIDEGAILGAIAGAMPPSLASLHHPSRQASEAFIARRKQAERRSAYATGRPRRLATDLARRITTRFFGASQPAPGENRA